MIKGIKKYTKSLDVTLQATKEKMGKEAVNSETEQIKCLKESLRAIKWNLKNIHTIGKVYYDAKAFENTKEGDFGESMRTFGSQDSPMFGTRVGDLIQRVGTVIKETQTAELALNLHSNTVLINPLEKLYTTEVKKVIEVKRRHDVARLKYDAAQSKVKDLQGKPGKSLNQAEEDLRSAKEIYDTITNELTSSFESMQQTLEIQLTEFLQSYITHQYNFYQQQFQLWSELNNEINGTQSDSILRESVAIPNLGPAPQKMLPVPSNYKRQSVMPVMA
eukprot:TRINITY_DN1222_c0_g1_i2.p1 TRINITY_DN1222_c0_g1~~TRINITY_DN1222_c0_g1_i2.p1  ORF type:complete len:276 (-),score=65.52 TRINITY_DN1222_c0_g1_i2:124-951(-)